MEPAAWLPPSIAAYEVWNHFSNWWIGTEADNKRIGRLPALPTCRNTYLQWLALKAWAWEAYYEGHQHAYEAWETGTLRLRRPQCLAMAAVFESQTESADWTLEAFKGLRLPTTEQRAAGLRPPSVQEVDQLRQWLCPAGSCLARVPRFGLKDDDQPRKGLADRSTCRECRIRAAAERQAALRPKSDAKQGRRAGRRREEEEEDRDEGAADPAIAQANDQAVMESPKVVLNQDT